MVDEQQGLDREGGYDIVVANAQQIVAIHLFASEREVGRAAINDRIGPSETANDEFVMDLVTSADARHLIERWRQDRSTRLAGHQYACRGADRIEADALGMVRDTIAEQLRILVQSRQRLVDRVRTFAAEFHHREEHVALGLSLLLAAIDPVKNLTLSLWLSANLIFVANASDCLYELIKLNMTKPTINTIETMEKIIILLLVSISAPYSLLNFF